MGFSLKNNIIYMCNMCHVYTFIGEDLPAPVMVMLFLRFSWTLEFKDFNITLYTIIIDKYYIYIYILHRYNIWPLRACHTSVPNVNIEIEFL